MGYRSLTRYFHPVKWLRSTDWMHFHRCAAKRTVRRASKKYHDSLTRYILIDQNMIGTTIHRKSVLDGHYAINYALEPLKRNQVRNWLLDKSNKHLASHHLKSIRFCRPTPRMFADVDSSESPKRDLLRSTRLVFYIHPFRLRCCINTFQQNFFFVLGYEVGDISYNGRSLNEIATFLIITTYAFNHEVVGI